jgi:hypothetical protein
MKDSANADENFSHAPPFTSAGKTFWLASGDLFPQNFPAQA